MFNLLIAQAISSLRVKMIEYITGTYKHGLQVNTCVWLRTESSHKAVYVILTAYWQNN